MPDAGTMRARYRRILRFSLRHMLLEWWFELFLPRIGLERFAARGRTARLQRIARRFHVLAVELGGLMIKVGQFLSSRLDVLPADTASITRLSKRAISLGMTVGAMNAVTPPMPRIL